MDFLVERTGRGVSVEGEWITAYCQRPREAQRCRKALVGYFRALRELDPQLPDLEVVEETLAEEDWAEAWRRFFKPRLIGRSIVIKPSWEQYTQSAGQLLIELDPGRAFGTGGHPSTALCIEVLEDLLGKVLGASVLDVGTGSGILGIVAAKLGAARVVGVDLDPEALQIAAANAAANRVADIMSVSDTPVGEVEERFQVVVANLTSEVLTSMAAHLSACVGPEGWLLISGILEDQVEQVTERYLCRGFREVETRSQGEWCAVLLRKASPSAGC